MIDRCRLANPCKFFSPLHLSIRLGRCTIASSYSLHDQISLSTIFYIAPWIFGFNFELEYLPYEAPRSMAEAQTCVYYCSNILLTDEGMWQKALIVFD